MTPHPHRTSLQGAAATLSALILLPTAPLAGQGTSSTEVGIPVRNETVVARCGSCHVPDAEGNLTRISYERKSPEGWQTSIRRMIALNDVELDPDEARAIARYLANNHGLAPEEMRPGLFEVERRIIDHRYLADTDVEFTCIQCHSMGRVITQRRTREEWELLMAMHRGYYPLVDNQAFRRRGPPPTEPGPDGEPPDTRHPVERAVDHLSEAFPLHTPEWTAWSATMRPPRLEGTWALSGHEPGGGLVYGTVTVSRAGQAEDEFTTRATYTYAASGETVSRAGQATVYTGYQWRGRTSSGGEESLREVMFVERGWREISGRWFTGAYDEFGMDVRLERVGSAAVVSGVHPPALESGGSHEVTIFGAGLASGLAADAFDFGPGVTVAEVVRSGEETATVRVNVATDAQAGKRDLFVDGASLSDAVVVHDGVDRIDVTPRTGMARLGGGAFPKGFQQFEAFGYDDGPDGRPDTDDDLALGLVPVSWSLEEYAAVFGDDDVDFVGSIDGNGLFTPELDGPNPSRAGNRNNVGDVWVVATFQPPGGGRELRARSHLVVTVPLYIRFDPSEMMR